MNTGAHSSTRRLLRALGPLAGLALVTAFFAAVAGPNFGTLENLQLVLLQTAVVGTAALGATFVIVAGGIDLSVGATIALGTMVLAHLLETGHSGFVAAAGAVVTGVGVGALIGSAVIGRLEVLAGAGAAGLCVYSLGASLSTPAVLGVAAAVLVTTILVGRRFLPRLELSPFIVTLGLWGALRGLAKGIGHNQPIYPNSSALQDLMARSSSVLGLPLGVWGMLLLALLLSVLLERTPFGRHVVAVGSNDKAARLCGIDVERTKLLVYALGVGCAGVAAVFQYAYVPIGDPTAAAGYELAVIAAVIIGGASLSGGEGTIRGTLVGALLMSIVASGCAKLQLANWVQEIVTGAIIVVAVALDRARQLGARRN